VFQNVDLPTFSAGKVRSNTTLLRKTLSSVCERCTASVRRIETASIACFENKVRVAVIETASIAWEAIVLPLNDTRTLSSNLGTETVWDTVSASCH
jgi:hypothetical protein